MPPAVLFAALSDLDASNPTVFLGLLVGALITLAVLVNVIDQIIDRRRRKPPIEVEFARKADLNLVDERLTSEVAKVRSYIAKSTVEHGEKLDSTLAVLKRDIEAQLNKTNEASDEGRREIHRKIETLTASIHAEFVTLNRAIGKLEAAK